MSDDPPRYRLDLPRVEGGNLYKASMLDGSRFLVRLLNLERLGLITRVTSIGSPEPDVHKWWSSGALGLSYVRLTHLGEFFVLTCRGRGESRAMP